MYPRVIILPVKLPHKVKDIFSVKDFIPSDAAGPEGVS